MPKAKRRFAIRRLDKDDITFYNGRQFVEGFEQLNNFIAQTTSGLAIDTFDFKLSGDVQFDWSNDPSEGSDEKDPRCLLKVGYESEGDANERLQ